MGSNIKYQGKSLRTKKLSRAKLSGEEVCKNRLEWQKCENIDFILDLFNAFFKKKYSFANSPKIFENSS